MLKKTAKVLLCTILFVFLFALTVSADTGCVTASALNIRQAPSTSAPVIGTLRNGDSVEVTASEGSWYKINFGGGVGYVYGSYITFTRESTPTSRSLTACGRDVVEYSKNFIGVPYRYGGSTPSGFDCSGFVSYVYRQMGVSLPRTSYSQMSVGVAVSAAELMPGDLVFFRSGGHVGIYVGNNQYIHAPQTGRTVSIDPMTRDLYCARRVIR